MFAVTLKGKHTYQNWISLNKTRNLKGIYFKYIISSICVHTLFLVAVHIFSVHFTTDSTHVSYTTLYGLHSKSSFILYAFYLINYNIKQLPILLWWNNDAVKKQIHPTIDYLMKYRQTFLLFRCVVLSRYHHCRLQRAYFVHAGGQFQL